MIKKLDRINIAIIGLGKQGKRLLSSVLKMPARNEIRINAVCDIQPIEQKVRSCLSAFRNTETVPGFYNNFRQMLESEKYLDIS